jgi:hypothetical protein
MLRAVEVMKIACLGDRLLEPAMARSLGFVGWWGRLGATKLHVRAVS